MQKLSWDACATKFYSLGYDTKAGFQRAYTKKETTVCLYGKMRHLQHLDAGGEPLPQSILQWLESNLVIRSLAAIQIH